MAQTIDYATGNSSGPASDNTSQAITPAQTESTTQPPAQPGNTETYGYLQRARNIIEKAVAAI